MKIVLDPGHGGNDPGGQSLGAAEKNTVLNFQKYLWKEFSDRGHTVLTTRVDDSFPTLAQRATFANDKKADIFLSLHCNAGPTAARGPWTLYCNGSASGKALSDKLQLAMARVANRNDDASYPDDSPWCGGRKLAVLRQTRMPAVILEFGFMTNPTDIKNLQSPAYQQAMAEAIAKALTQA